LRKIEKKRGSDPFSNFQGGAPYDYFPIDALNATEV